MLAACSAHLILLDLIIQTTRIWVYYEYIVGFEVFTAVVAKFIIFWDITPCSTLIVNRRFGGTYRFHLQGQRPNVFNILCQTMAYAASVLNNLYSLLKCLAQHNSTCWRVLDVKLFPFKYRRALQMGSIMNNNDNVDDNDDDDDSSIQLKSLFIYVLTQQPNGQLWSKHEQKKWTKQTHTDKQKTKQDHLHNLININIQ
jgi:hypothetical protein